MREAPSSGELRTPEGAAANHARRVWVRYLIAATVLHSAWELLHLPLYDVERFAQLWRSELFPLLCVAPDVAIAAGSLALASQRGNDGWPVRHYTSVAAGTIIFGLAFTVLSEWVNVYLLQTWGYAQAMPMIPLLGVGLSPVAQWLAVPLASLWWARWGTT